MNRSLLQELTIGIDTDDKNAVSNIRQTINRANKNPQRANIEALKKAKDNVRVATQAQQSPTKVLDVKIAKLQQQIAQLQQQRNRITQRNETYTIIEDKDGNIIKKGYIKESVVQAYKRQGNVVKRQFRCTSGKKDGKIVSDPSECTKRKNPKSVRAGKKSAKSKKSIRINKTKIAKRKSLSRMVTRMNQRYGG